MIGGLGSIAVAFWAGSVSRCSLRGWSPPAGKSMFPDVDFAPIAEGFGFEAATIRTLEDLHRVAPKLRKPEGPLLLDCKINADVAAPFMSEFAHFEARH